MARLTDKRKAELTRSLPAAEITKKAARAYMAAANLSPEQFARLLNYSLSAVEKFTHGDYSRAGTTDLFIRKAIEDFISAHPVGVALTKGQGKLYETRNVEEIRQWFNECHEEQQLGYIYGPPGSQKTFAIEHVVAEFNRREIGRDNARNRAYLIWASINITPRDLLRKICKEIGAPVTGGIQRTMDAIRFQLRGSNSILVIDEAQFCGIPVLEALRELNDHDPHLGILLAGSHKLKNFFDRYAADLEQWNSRIAFGAALSGVSDQNARAIITAERSDLSRKAVDDLINHARVADKYNRNKPYISMRRIFLSLKALKRLEAQAKGVAA